MNDRVDDSLAITTAAYRDAWRRGAQFTGRTARVVYWRFFGTNLVIMLCLSWLWHPLEMIYALAVLVPSLAIATRRLHDTGRTAWWLTWLGVVVLMMVGGHRLLFGVGVGVWLILFMAWPGQPRANRWGDVPASESGRRMIPQDLQ